MTNSISPENFWPYVDSLSGASSCWPWTKLKNKAGYGIVHVPRSRGGNKLLAHRVAFLLGREDIPDNMCVLHTCDNPPCCNPDHLKIGTQADNLRDMFNKGRARSRSLSGERHGRSKITDKELAEAKLLYSAGGVTQSALAERFGLTVQHMHRLLRGECRGEAATSPIKPNRSKFKRYSLSDEQISEVLDLLSRGIVQATIAKRTGMSQSQVCRINNGFRNHVHQQAPS